MQIKLISDQDVTRIRALLDCYQLAPSGPVAEGLLAEAAKILEWHQQSCDILAGATINDITEREHQAAGDGWIANHGGECPLPWGTLIDIRFRGGDEHLGVKAMKGLAGDDYWQNDDSPADIIAYRLHTPDVGSV